MEGAPHESHPSLTDLPEELRSSGRQVVKALSTDSGVAQAFADFCSRAYVKPAWAGAASEFLVTLFEDRQDQLAEMTRIPDLIIELASGHLSLTCMVAYRWAAHSDTARLSKLAEALAATQSKMSDPEVVHIMLALVTSLAITRYPRAEQMMAVAEPQAGEEHQEGLQEARLWLAAGRIVRGCGQESRDLWDHRLRRRRTAWTWETPAECAALNELSEHLTPDQEGASLFKAITPAAWWDLAIQRATERIERPEPEPAPISAPAPISPNASLQPTAPSVQRSEPAPVIMVLSMWSFFAGGVAGAAVLALMIWILPYELVKPRPTQTATPAVTTKTPAQATESPEEIWRRDEAAKAAKESSDLQPLFDKVHAGTWADHESLLSGATPDLPKEDPRYVRLIAWLHLDPPADVELRNRLPSLLAAVRPDSDTLDLWEKLVYQGSPMKAAIHQAAQRQYHENKDAWSPSQERQVLRLGWP